MSENYRWGKDIYDINRSGVKALESESGEAARIAIGMKISIGKFFGAEHFVHVTNSQIMGDTEVMDMYREMEMTFWLEKPEGAMAGAG